jgi:hypothetical protein
MTPTISERLTALEREVSEMRAMAKDVSDIKKTLADIKRYSLWILFGLVVPVSQALGLPDLSELFK